MLLGGDEIGRTQRGNNNAYCQDNEISWFDWEQRRRASCCAFVARLIALRDAAPVFRRRRWFQGRAVHGDGDAATSAGSRPTASEMTDEDWHSGFARSRSACSSTATPSPTPDARGERIVDDGFCCSSTPTSTRMRFSTPGRSCVSAVWRRVVDSAGCTDAVGNESTCGAPSACPVSRSSSFNGTTDQPTGTRPRAVRHRRAVAARAASAGSPKHPRDSHAALRDLGVDVDVVLPDYGGVGLEDEHAFDLDVPSWPAPLAGATASRPASGTSP